MILHFSNIPEMYEKGMNGLKWNNIGKVIINHCREPYLSYILLALIILGKVILETFFNIDDSLYISLSVSP